MAFAEPSASFVIPGAKAGTGDAGRRRGGKSGEGIAAADKNKLPDHTGEGGADAGKSAVGVRNFREMSRGSIGFSGTADGSGTVAITGVAGISGSGSGAGGRRGSSDKTGCGGEGGCSGEIGDGAGKIGSLGKSGGTISRCWMMDERSTCRPSA